MLTEKQAHVSTLYVHRPLVNAEQLLEWASGQGFTSTLEPHDMHVTIAFSKNPVPWHALSPILEHLQVDGGQRKVSPLGEKGAVVLHFNHPHLSERWQHFCNTGASWDHPRYQPHVTITYDGGSVPLHRVQPYTGPLIFGPEQFAPLDENWNEKIRELPLVVEKQGLLQGNLSSLVKYGESRWETNRMTELSTLLMKNIDLILEAYSVDKNGSLVVANKRKVTEADEVFHEYFVKSMNTMFRRLNENDPIMNQPDGMGMVPHGHDDLGIGGDDMMGDMSPMGHPHEMGHGMEPGMEPGMEHGMGPEMGHHDMSGGAGGLPPQMHQMKRPFDPTTQFESSEADSDWLFNENVDDMDINGMFDISEDEEQDDDTLNEFGMHDDQDMMGGDMDMEGGNNDFGGDMGGMTSGDGGMGGDMMGGDMDGGMGGDMMGGGDEEMITIHGQMDNGGDFNFSFDPNTLGFGDDMGGDQMGGGESHGHEDHGHEDHGHEDHGHEDHHGGGFGHPDEPGMGEEDEEPQVAEGAFHNGKPRRTSKGGKSARMAVVPANPKAGHAAPFPTPQGARQKH